MKLIPAIDLKEGKAVRLKQGRMDDDTVFSDNPVEMANKWVKAGTDRLHLVDLDGAFAGEPINKGVIESILQAHPDLTIQVGGGIRDEATAKAYVDAGVKYVIIGSQAVKDPDFVSRLCQTLPGHVIVGLDAKQGKVATEGWAEDSGVDLVDLAKRFEGDGVEAIIFTDIARDGMMQGLNLEATIDLAQAVDIPVIASGGVTDMQDIVKLCEAKETGVVGTIIGRAIYEGTLDLREAQNYAQINGL